MKSNLLTLVQDILSAMNSDEVDDIDDTEESKQVYRIAREVFYELQTLRDWGHKKEVVKLTASGDNTQPTRMMLPENILKTHWVRYDKRLDGASAADYKEVEYVQPDEFINRTANLNPTDTNVTAVTDTVQSFTFNVYNDRAPSICTSFDDEYLWFDAYDSSIETTLQSNKSMVYATVMQAFTSTNSYVPDVPNKDWALYKNLVKSRCFEEIKQIEAPQTNSIVRRLLIKSQINNGQRVDGQYPGVNYGR